MAYILRCFSMARLLILWKIIYVFFLLPIHQFVYEYHISVFRSYRNMLNQSITSATGYFTLPHAVLMFSSLIPGRCGYAIKTPNNFPTVAKVYRGREAHYLSECTKFEGFILIFEAINAEKLIRPTSGYKVCQSNPTVRKIIPDVPWHTQNG